MKKTMILLAIMMGLAVPCLAADSGMAPPAANGTPMPSGMMPGMAPGMMPQAPMWGSPMGMPPGMMMNPGMGRGMMGAGPYGYAPGMMGGSPYGYGPGYMMGQGMMRFGMGPGMIRGLGMMGYIPSEAFQKFFDETRTLRKELHDLMFDYAEVLRQPKIDREKRIELENKIQSLRQKIYEKAPRYQFWPN